MSSVFSQHPEVEEVILYGSRAKGNYSNGSDIDFVLIGKNLDLKKLRIISRELDDLLLPYTIDLALYDHIKNSDLIDHINRVGKSFYKK